MQTFEHIKESGAYLEPAATPIRVENASDDLEARGYARIPEDYGRLLQFANGTQSRAFILLGTEPQELAGGDEEPAILEATEQALKDEYISSGLVLGRVSTDLLLVYSPDSHHYLLIDKTTGDIFQEFKTISDFIADKLA